jgi:hypothetical protein
MLAYMVPCVVMRARLPYICVWQREPSRECLRPEGLSYRSKLAPGMVSRPWTSKRLCCSGLRPWR